VRPQLAHQRSDVARNALLVGGVVSDAVLVDPSIDDRALVCGMRVARLRRTDKDGQQRREKDAPQRHARDSSGRPTRRQGDTDGEGRAWLFRRAEPLFARASSFHGPSRELEMPLRAQRIRGGFSRKDTRLLDGGTGSSDQGALILQSKSNQHLIVYIAVRREARLAGWVMAPFRPEGTRGVVSARVEPIARETMGSARRRGAS
jgi:hypothetical protein